ncbi:hypothetical protein P8452_46521 [Trifolium repens]|jgi:hypothetical protein|nr:hypothetical protein P8452_46521 [Trifolium repens]
MAPYHQVSHPLFSVSSLLFRFPFGFLLYRFRCVLFYLGVACCCVWCGFCVGDVPCRNSSSSPAADIVWVALLALVLGSGGDCCSRGLGVVSSPELELVVVLVFGVYVRWSVELV